MLAHSYCSSTLATESSPSFYKHVTPTTIHKVRVAILWHCRGRDFCWAGNAALSRRCKLSERTIRYALQAMIHHQDIRVEIHSNRRGRTIFLLRPHPDRTMTGKPIFLPKSVPSECHQDAGCVPSELSGMVPNAIEPNSIINPQTDDAVTFVRPQETEQSPHTFPERSESKPVSTVQDHTQEAPERQQEPLVARLVAEQITPKVAKELVRDYRERIEPNCLLLATANTKTGQVLSCDRSNRIGHCHQQ